MPKPDGDRNLLFGLLALQMDFIGRDALISALGAWALDKSKTLGQILLEQKALAADTFALMEALVQKHLALHGDDAAKSLAAVGSVSSVRDELRQIADPELHASLAHVAQQRDREDDPYATATGVAVGASTSSGARFRILRPHAKGGLGEVYVAHDEEVHREVALKEIRDRHADNPESRARFLLEAEITGGLEHPGIVPVYGLGTYADGRPFYAMRFIKGDSLKDAVERFHKAGGGAAENRTVAFRKLLGRVIDVCNAIGYAHSRGVLHRDLKPGNIMLGKYGETLVVDWGLAKASGKHGAASRSTSSTEHGLDEQLLHPSSGSGVAETVAGTALGTPAFMSPEQAAGRLDRLGPASDVYSLGATLYCLLTGRAPFEDKDIGDVLLKVQQGEFPRPRQIKPAVPAPLEAICLKAMARQPSERYDTPRALADDIEHWLADEPVVAWPEPMTVTASRWMRRHKPLVSGAAAALLVSLVALTAGAIWRHNQQAEAARRQEFAEMKVREGLKDARYTRDVLHKNLKRPGGLQQLLNQPARWQERLSSARAGWHRAHGHVEGTLDPQWTAQLDALNAELARDQADFKLAQRLEQIHLDTATLVEGKFDYTRAEPEYLAAFQMAGLDIAPGQQKNVAELIRQSPIKDQLLAALDHWAWVAHRNKRPELTGRLLEVARRADADPWRDKVRDPSLWTNGKAMEQLADEVRADRVFLARLSPQMLFLVDHGLPPGKTEEAWMRTAQALHPTDFWINFRLAAVLSEKGAAAESTGFYRVALAIRPDNATVYNNLGVALRRAKDLPAAVDAYRNALAIDPQFATTWSNLGRALHDQHDVPAAIDAYRKALAIEPKYINAWSGLALALSDNNDLAGALDAANNALPNDANLVAAWFNLGDVVNDPKRLRGVFESFNKSAFGGDSDPVRTWFNLGNAMRAKNDLPKAIFAYKKAIFFDAKNVAAWNNLGNALTDSGDFPSAVNAFNSALAIDPKYALARKNLVHAEKLLALEKRLPGVLAGEAANAQDLLALADLCRRYKKRHRDAAELYAKAFAAEPKRGEDLNEPHRYDGARAAAIAAASKGGDGNKLAAKEQARFRKLALDWLKQDLSAHATMLPTNPVEVEAAMQTWQRDADLAGLRDGKELTELAADERAVCQELWVEVDRLAKQARASYKQTDHKGQLSVKDRAQNHPIELKAGTTYAIDLESPLFDAYLRLEDDQGKIVAENDDVSPGNPHARIVFVGPADRVYRIVATSFQQRGIGTYTLRIREFVVKKRS